MLLTTVNPLDEASKEGNGHVPDAIQDILEVLDVNATKIPSKQRMMHRFFRLLHVQHQLGAETVPYFVG